MPGYTLGRLNFDKQRRGSTESAEQIIAVHDCAPPPRGSRLNGNPAAQWPAEIQPTFLQPSEIGRIVAGATAPPGPSDFGAIMASVMANLGLKPLAIDLALVPNGWHRVTPCMRSTIAYLVEGDIIDVEVTTTVEAVFGGETYPAGDRIASFRVLNPRRYRFLLRHEHNPGCCQGYHVVPPPEQSDWFPEGERDIKIDFGAGYDWNWNWKGKWSLSPGLEYNFQGEDSARPDDDLQRQIEDLKRRIREIEERLHKAAEGSGN
ncbi:MAG: hypothetical protein AB7O49_09865 [Sphingomonadales bacterium]